MMKPALPTLAFHIKSKSIPPPPEQENVEANQSIEREMIRKESVEIDVQQQQPSSQEEVAESKTILDKAKHLYAHSLEDLDSYIKSLTNLSLEDPETRATTLTHLKDDLNEDDSEISKKKWTIFDMIKLGFKDDQIKEALVYLESLSDDLTKEEMLKKAIEHVVVSQRHLETVIEIEEEDRQMPSQNIPPVNESVFRLYQPPAPPRSSNPSPKRNSKKIVVAVQKIQEATLPKEDLSEIPCLICYDFIPKSFIRSGKPILPCEHQFCRPCYVAYLQDKINNNKVLNIGCPSDGCSENFEEKHLTNLLTKSDIEKYKRFKKAAILSQNPNLRWCIKEGCDKYVIGDDKARKVVCECGMQMCYKCGNQYHNRKSCNSIINGVYKKYAKEKNVKNCPLCRARTEKAEGCNHITCTVCSYQWCWLCRRKYTLDHYNPENLEGCPGLQHAETKPKKKVTPIDIAKKVLGFIGTLLMLPFLIVFATMYLPHWIYDKRQEKKYGPSYAQNPNNDPGLRLFLSVIGLVAFPLLFVGFIIGGTVYICSDLFGKPKIRRVQGNNS